MVDLFQARFLAISECSQETFFLGPVFIEGGISGLQTFNIRKKGSYAKGSFWISFSLWSIPEKYPQYFWKRKLHYVFFPYVFESFVEAISKHSHEKICYGV